MGSATPLVRKAIILAPGQGRSYPMGRMRAVFKADTAETDSRYSVSEWWLDPNTKGPGIHAHPEDHVFYVIEGTVSISIDGEWSHAVRGSYALIPGGTPHDFENHGTVRCGFISLNVPGGFELAMPGIVQWFAANPLGDAGTFPT
jgi:mannose-6-phosphate isomerase-like protein (cupin superfamily)